MSSTHFKNDRYDRKVSDYPKKQLKWYLEMAGLVIKGWVQLGRNKRMTVRGVEYLNKWMGENVPPLPVRGDVLIRALAQKLRDDARAMGFTIVDLEIEGSQVEQFIRETILQTSEWEIPATE